MLDRHQVDWLVHGADRVFHLAAAVGVRRIVEEPLESLRVNLHGTENVLEAARAAGATVLLASTSEIYGKNTSDALSEDADRILGSPLISRWTYAAAKGIDEAFAHAFWRERGLRWPSCACSTPWATPDRALRHGGAQPGGPGAAG